jgi:protein O-GlcNAc transferase
MSRSKKGSVHQPPNPSRAPQSPQLATELQTALALHQQAQLGSAEAAYQAILEKAPNHFDALHLLGLIKYQQGDFAAAARLIHRALRIDAQFAPAHLNLGNALTKLQRHREALASYDRALAIRPDYANALSDRGNALFELRRYAEALASYDRALAIDPGFAEALYNRGNALRALARREEALASYDRALVVRPGYAEALCHRGNLLCELGRRAEALASYEQALAIKPDYAEALYNLGNALCALERHAEALAGYERALAIRPDYAEAFFNRGYALCALERHAEALASYDWALAIKANYPEARYARGTTLLDLQRYEEAIEEFERLRLAAPDYEYAQGQLLNAKLCSCDWQNYDRDVALIKNEVAAGKRAIFPFTMLAASDSPSAQLQCAKTYGSDQYAVSEKAVWNGERYCHERIRVAYLSADFHDHATAYLIAGLIEAHDRTRFETVAISFGPDNEDRLRARLKHAFDRFLDVSRNVDYETARLLKDLEIDIAVDLKGYTRGGRTGIFSFRPAPVQVNWLGFPGTLGLDYIDYIIADRFVIPEDAHAFYTEQVVYLPDSYYPTDGGLQISGETPTRAAAGLPEAGFVFCSFNNNYKISPAVFDVWMRLLNQVEGSVLWLLEGSAAAVRNLRQNAAVRGVDQDRLVFAPRMRLDDHLARQRLAGLVLDTLPYNAHTTASDALWAGVPVVTCLGSTFVGRVAASLLNAVGLPELITGALAEYETLALQLARDPGLLTTLKAKLARNRQTFPLFDTDRLRRHIESAYQTMWERCQEGLPPASFTVPVCR